VYPTLDSGATITIRLVAGDEIGSPDGDPYEVYRILFDLTFFFFVIVILLAIIQGQSHSLRFSA